MNDQRTDAIAAMVDAARELLRDEARFIELARTIGRLARHIDPELNDAELTGFVAVDSESDGIVWGDALSAWAPELRPAKLSEAQRFVRTYRDGSLRDAKILIGRYGAA